MTLFRNVLWCTWHPNPWLQNSLQAHGNRTLYIRTRELLILLILAAKKAYPGPWPGESSYLRCCFCFLKGLCGHKSLWKCSYHCKKTNKQTEKTNNNNNNKNKQPTMGSENNLGLIWLSCHFTISPAGERLHQTRFKIIVPS